ncbi:tellurite resistance methyltransferase TehB [Pantoea sp. 1.19]|uniref:tellurite resistance methyltransferase TehB n=1 Tax=Pantoea sp. 1.19 TaxID=1925589 RepID=UPI000A4688CB|nr:tellurite resistance methyltransferase TehB [Pantoea sp. 1.19]
MTQQANGATLQAITARWGLNPAHSELQAALPLLHGGRALDLGCGVGRNALWLQQHGFAVTAWDNDPRKLDRLRQMIAAEALSEITVEAHDLNRLRFNGAWDLVICTVVMMFLQPESIPQLIADMQASTVKGGYNLIVAAMDTEDAPCLQPFPFTFRSGELSHYYRRWQIMKYNEDLGQLHRVDADGNRITQRFATLLARKAPPE